MIDPFSLVLNSAASWAVGRLLDSAVSCICGSMHERDVENNATSNLYCPRCCESLDQYTNATQHTVNRNGSIAAAYISDLRWNAWGGLFSPRFNPHFRIRAVNSKYEDLVVRFELSEFQGSTFFSDQMILRPQYERSHFDELWWKVSPETFPEGRLTFAVDITVFNTWGDELHRVRSLSDKR